MTRKTNSFVSQQCNIVWIVVQKWNERKHTRLQPQRENHVYVCALHLLLLISKHSNACHAKSAFSCCCSVCSCFHRCINNPLFLHVVSYCLFDGVYTMRSVPSVFSFIWKQGFFCMLSGCVTACARVDNNNNDANKKKKQQSEKK